MMVAIRASQRPGPPGASAGCAWSAAGTGVRDGCRLPAAGPSTPANPRPAPQGKAAKEAESIRAARDRRIALAVAARFNAGEQPAVIAATLNGAGTPPPQPTVTARLLWQTPALRDAAITALTETLGLESDGGPSARAPAEEVYDSAQPGNPVILQWTTPELRIRLRCMRATGGIADTLGINPEARPKGKALEAAIRTRRSALAQFLAADGADPERPELALIEIDRRRDFAHPLDDPKFAIRLGCADAGVLTQFVLVPKKAKRYNSVKNLDHRVHSGWQDGLRQLGVRVLPEHTVTTGVPEGLRYAALWMVKRRKDGPTRLPRHTPVAVMVTPAGVRDRPRSSHRLGSEDSAMDPLPAVPAETGQDRRDPRHRRRRSR